MGPIDQETWLHLCSLDFRDKHPYDRFTFYDLLSKLRFQVPGWSFGVLVVLANLAFSTRGDFSSSVARTNTLGVLALAGVIVLVLVVYFWMLHRLGTFINRKTSVGDLAAIIFYAYEYGEPGRAILAARRILRITEGRRDRPTVLAKLLSVFVLTDFVETRSEELLRRGIEYAHSLQGIVEDLPYVYYCLGAFNYDLGNTSNALQYFERYSELQPDDLRIKEYLKGPDPDPFGGSQASRPDDEPLEE